MYYRVVSMLAYAVLSVLQYEVDEAAGLLLSLAHCEDSVCVVKIPDYSGCILKLLGPKASYFRIVQSAMSNTPSSTLPIPP